MVSRYEKSFTQMVLKYQDNVLNMSYIFRMKILETIHIFP